MSEAPQTPRVEPGNSPHRLTDAQTDGPIDIASPEMPARRRRLPGDVCAIFVHAGAGYHSLQNEKIHLAACEEYVALDCGDLSLNLHSENTNAG